MTVKIESKANIVMNVKKASGDSLTVNSADAITKLKHAIKQLVNVLTVRRIRLASTVKSNKNKIKYFLHY